MFLALYESQVTIAQGFFKVFSKKEKENTSSKMEQWKN